VTIIKRADQEWGVKSVSNLARDACIYAIIGKGGIRNRIEARLHILPPSKLLQRDAVIEKEIY
jgi:hypothetical protein